jgi:hypothetical protein
MQSTAAPPVVVFNDAVFLTVDNPQAWYEKHSQRMRLQNVSFVTFQVEHCAETGVVCLRGFAQSVHLKNCAMWRNLLDLGSGAVVQASPGTATLMARQCMTAGVDVLGRRWSIVKPHITHGTITIRRVEQMCLDVIDGVPNSEIAERYPRPWKHYRRSIASFRRILDNTADASDLERAARGDMIPIVFDVCVHRDFINNPPPTDPNSYLAD